MSNQTKATPSPAKEAWILGKFSPSVQWLRKFTLMKMIKSFSTYQPVLLGGQVVQSGDRECAERWKLIEGAISNRNIENLLDLGCAEGYFVKLAASQLGCVAVGVDGDARRIAVAQSVANQDNLPRAGFILGNLDTTLISKLPAFDVIIFCSVLHHIIRERGLNEASTVMNLVRARTKRTLIFDMGQSNEIQYPWSGELPKMEPDPVTWITAYLKSFGFREVRVIGETVGYQNAYPRYLFAADV